MKPGSKWFAAIAALGLMMPFGSAISAEEMVKGEVTKVSPDTGKLTIKHGPIKKFDMDSMTMVFKAGDPKMIEQVKPGDRILFQLDQINGQFTVTKIEKAK